MQRPNERQKRLSSWAINKRFGCFETLSCWARNGDENTKREGSLNPKGCSNCDRAPFDTKARLESRSSLSVYTKSVSILPVNVPVSCKSLMSLGRIRGICYFWQFHYIRLLMLAASELLKPLVCSQCHTAVDGFALLRPEFCAGTKVLSRNLWKWKCFTYWI